MIKIHCINIIITQSKENKGSNISMLIFYIIYVKGMETVRSNNLSV